MFQSRGKVIPLHDGSVVGDAAASDAAAEFEVTQAGSIRSFPSVTTMPRLPLMIPDEILDYYGWVFCQGGFLNLQMTFEQFLAVVAAVSPSALCPECDTGEGPASD